MSGQEAAIGMQVAGTIMGGMGQQSQGTAQRGAAYYSATQLDVNAGQAEAASQLDAAAEIHKAKLLQSRALAVAAASGGGTLNSTVLRLISGIAGEGELAAQTQLYKGSERARGMRDQAAAARYEGDQSKRAANTRTLTTILSGAKSIYDVGGFAFDGSNAKILTDQGFANNRRTI